MLEHRPGDSRELSGHGPLALIETLRQRLKANREMRCLRERQEWIFITRPGIACPFLFAIAGALAVDPAAVRSKIVRIGKTSTGGGFNPADRTIL
jgi:hypothetical protein